MSIDRGYGIATSAVLADSYDLDALIADTEAAKVAAEAAQAAAETAQSAAETAETNAETAETNAASSASAAATSESNIAGSEAVCAASETAAAASASAAATSESNAATSETNAAASATSASTSASTATTQASNASTSASAAATSATNASTSETNAATSATSAAASATAAQAALDSFESVYLGASASAPTTDDNGDPLTAGDWYFNTTDNKTYVYNGSSFQEAVISTDNVVEKTSDTGSAVLPSGTTAERDGTPVAGYLRWNETEGSAEVYDGTDWGSVGGGGAATTVYAEHANTLSENLEIASGNNAVSGGPITINSGYSVTVPSGSVWTIV